MILPYWNNFYANYVNQNKSVGDERFERFDEKMREENKSFEYLCSSTMSLSFSTALLKN